MIISGHAKFMGYMGLVQTGYRAFSTHINNGGGTFSPCIMCVQYCGGYHDACEGYFVYRGGVQYHGGYHKYCGVILSTVGTLSTMGDIMMHLGDIMMHIGDIMSTMGCSVLWGKSFVI